MLLDLLQRDPASKKVEGVLCCEMKQLIGLIESAEVKLTLSELEILFTRLFENSGSLEAIPIHSIYSIFDVQKLAEKKLNLPLKGETASSQPI